VLAAVQQLAPEFEPGDVIVAISPDLGEKYLDTIYDTAWVDNVIMPESRAALRSYPAAPSRTPTHRTLSMTSHSSAAEAVRMEVRQLKGEAIKPKVVRRGRAGRSNRSRDQMRAISRVCGAATSGTNWRK
jgi:hypothetical protein